MSLHPDEKASFDVPVDACDSHFHVFGPNDHYPPGTAQLRYEPPVAPLSDYLQLADRLHLTRQVFVQPSAYGRDNRCMLDAMRELGHERSRGIVDVDENAPDALLAEMNALGVRGVRINVSPILPVATGLADDMKPRIQMLAARCAELGWHLDFLLPGWLTKDLLPVMRRLQLPYSLAHLGMNLARDGVDSPSFQSLLGLLRQGESEAYVKFTGIYRISKVPGYADVDPMAVALIEAAPERIIWGSDYPHLSFGDKSSVDLFNLLGRWTASTEVRKKILVDNPARLFGY
jgi:2-pyrone-4,6-dicarboxylate lactonase